MAKADTKSEATHDEVEPQGSRLAWLREAPPWLVSSVIHTIVIILLALATLPQLQQAPDVSLQASTSDSVDEIAEIPELEFEEVEIENPTPLSEFDPSAMALGDMADSEFLADVGSMSTAAMLSNIGSPLGESGSGLDPIGSGEGAMTSFFGSKSAANRIVFMVDNSNSMTGGKLETALVEMAKSIDALQKTQRFYIVFYSDTAYPLFHPEPAEMLVPATTQNKQKAIDWLGTIEMCLRTDGRDALAITRQLRPNLVYLLGDGAFTDRTAQALIDNPIRGATIHTLGMKVNAKNAEEFRAIAEKHEGTYRDVGVTAEGQSLLKQTGNRPRHRFHEGYWGLKLPEPK